MKAFRAKYTRQQVLSVNQKLLLFALHYILQYGYFRLDDSIVHLLVHLTKLATDFLQNKALKK